MRYKNLKLFSLILALIFQLHSARCGGETNTAKTFPVVVFSDVHINPFYDPTLFPALVTDNAKQTLYRGYYYSGNNSLSPIADSNWPVYWCGIGYIDEQGLIDCVNSY
jgi:sphingomyelin phosphodiesterase acid-like 3